MKAKTDIEPLAGKAAYSLSELVRCAPRGLGKTKIYEEINKGRLRARKIGRTTVVLHEDFEEFLRSLPEYRAAS